MTATREVAAPLSPRTRALDTRLADTTHQHHVSEQNLHHKRTGVWVELDERQLLSSPVVVTVVRAIEWLSTVLYERGLLHLPQSILFLLHLANTTLMDANYDVNVLLTTHRRSNLVLLHCICVWLWL